jgi:hypothetical protein
MLATEKMLLLVGLLRSVYGQWQFRRFLSGVAIVVGLILITSVLISALLISGFYVAYIMFQHYGWEPQAALALTGFLAVLTTAICVVFTASRLRRLRDMPQQLFHKSTLAHRANETIDAFFDGLMTDDVR